jgi:hypothetical protein
MHSRNAFHCSARLLHAYLRANVLCGFLYTFGLVYRLEVHNNLWRRVALKLAIKSNSMLSRFDFRRGRFRLDSVDLIALGVVYARGDSIAPRAGAEGDIRWPNFSMRS